MNEHTPFLDIFPGAAVHKDSCGGLEKAYVTDVEISIEAKTMSIRAWFVRTPAPAELDMLAHILQGDYGLISVVMLDKMSDEALFVSEWLMSCRVLKRGMEEFIVNDIISTARENGFKRVIGEYVPTAKNAMVADLYERMSFRKEAGLFIADTDTFEMRKTYITEEEE